jgi:hypothetical protein
MAFGIWSLLAVVLVIAFCVSVFIWSHKTRQSTEDELTPSQPPAGPGAEGMHVFEPGEISPGAPEGDQETTS